MKLRPLALALALLATLAVWFFPIRGVSHDIFPAAPGSPLVPFYSHPLLALSIHRAAAALVGIFGWHRFGRPFPAVVAALLTAIHPAATEVLAAPAHAPLALALFFFCLAAWALRAPSPRRHEIAGAVLTALFGLMVLFPALADGWRATAVAYSSDPAYTPIQALSAAPWLWFRSLRCLLVPWPLNIAQPIPAVAPFSVSFWIGLAWLVAAVWGAIAARRALTDLSFALLWMLAAFLPFSNLIPLPQPVADRYLYFMVPGFSLAVASVLARHDSRGARCAGAIVLFAIYAALVRMRLDQWRTSDALWAAAAFHNPTSVSVNLECARLCDLSDNPEGAAAFRAVVDHLQSPASP